LIPVELILLALSPIFVACIVFEYVKARQYFNIKDSVNNAVLAALHQGSDAIALLLLMPFFIWLHQFAFFNIELSIWTLLLGFLIQDFLYYWFHRASHTIHWFWLAHVVHHSSPFMNFTTAFRQSIFYPIVGMWLFWMPMIIIGFSPSIVFLIVALNLGYQFFVHTQTIRKLGWLEKVFNTPTHHRIHHAINPPYINKNYAGVLIVWDKLFGTYVDEDPNLTIEYGIVGEMPKANPISANCHQFVKMFKAFRQASGLKAKLKVVFSDPTHSEQL
jgi:sterol desaturase/sphingolipid hydroxylase (fatty acid hydroxylase superfamily)